MVSDISMSVVMANTLKDTIAASKRRTIVLLTTTSVMLVMGLQQVERPRTIKARFTPPVPVGTRKLSEFWLVWLSKC